MTPTLPDSRTVVAVIGAGSMGAGIAQVAAQAGHAVRLHDAQPGAAAKGLARIAADLDGAVTRGRLDADERAAILGRITVAETIDALAGCGLAVEAIVERLEVKQQVFRALEQALGPGAVLATNTSSISITAVAQALEHPARVIGWHFFNPPTRMKLVEIISGLETDPRLPGALRELSIAWGKTPVDAPNAPGFIVNRVARPYYAEGLRLLAERIASAPAIDRLLREAGGFAMGPFELMDLIGHDVNLSVTESVFQATGHDPRYAPNLIQQELVRAGRLGRKSGRGFYDHRKGAEAPAVATVEPTRAAAPARIDHAADLGLLAPLVERLRAAGVATAVRADLAAETFALGPALVGLTDGRTAAGRHGGPLLLLDLARDYSTTTTVGATANRAGEPHLGALAAALATAGIATVPLADVAGLVVMRIVCGLANEAADVATWTTTTPADIDTAMRLGTAYPLGPLAWADALGPARVAGVLSVLQAHYGEVRYRRAPRLSALQHGGGRFLG